MAVTFGIDRVDAEVIPLDPVDDWNREGPLVLVNGSQEGWQPVVTNLAVSVQENNNLVGKEKQGKFRIHGAKCLRTK